MSGRTAPLRANTILRRIHMVPKPVGVEVGVFIGSMSMALLQGHRGLHLYMVDNWLPTERQPQPYQESEDFHSKLTATAQQQYQVAATQRTAQYANRRTVLVLASTEAAAKVVDGGCDFVFLDADHSYEGTREAIEVWWPKIKPGGWLCGHDYKGWVWMGHGRGEQDKKYFGVTLAVDEAAKMLGVTMEQDVDGTWFFEKMMKT